MQNNNEELCGCCGFYCASCPVHIAYKKGIEYQRKLASALSQQLQKTINVTEIQCPGCSQAKNDKDAWGFKCKLRACAIDLDVENCGECKEFPCKMLMDLSDTYDGIPIQQMQELNEDGKEKWLQNMEKRWKCPKCNGSIEAGTKKCGSCNRDLASHVNETINKKRG